MSLNLKIERISTTYSGSEGRVVNVALITIPVGKDSSIQLKLSRTELEELKESIDGLLDTSFNAERKA